MAEDFALNVDFAVLRHGKEKSLLAWGDPVRVVGKHADRFDVEVVTWVGQPDKSLKPVISTGTLKRKLRVDGVDREVALPADQVRVLKLSFVDVQQGDGTLIQTPERPGDHARRRREPAVRALPREPLPRHGRGQAPGDRRDGREPRRRGPLLGADGDLRHGDRRPAGLQAASSCTRSASSTTDSSSGRKESRSSTSFGATQTPPGEDPVVTALETDLTAVPAASMNTPFKAWRKALIEWSKAGHDRLPPAGQGRQRPRSTSSRTRRSPSRYSGRSRRP